MVGQEKIVKRMTQVLKYDYIFIVRIYDIINTSSIHSINTLEKKENSHFSKQLCTKELLKPMNIVVLVTLV